jgi:dihydrofolate synthase / folylpolyglutamate synthase
MRFHTLQEWLDWQETLHPRSIDLGLERIATVADALGLRDHAPPTVTVAGTNGKGTVATVTSALLRGLGFRVGLYTSPHLLRYNERVTVDGAPVSDDDLCRAFAAIDAARGPSSLTYFEFGTLAAAWLFRDAARGLPGAGGGAGRASRRREHLGRRCGRDHQRRPGSPGLARSRPRTDRLGKGGILRPGRPVVLGEESPPESVLREARRRGATMFRYGHDFLLDLAVAGGFWSWGGQSARLGLEPALSAALEGARGQNSATALAVLHVLGLQERLSPEALRAGLSAAPAGRLQRLPGSPEWLLDVAHNPQSARELARWLAAHPLPGPTVAIVALMGDKERGPMLETLRPAIDTWIPIRIPSARALSAAELARELQALPGSGVILEEDPQAAMDVAREWAGPGGRIVVFGSFLTVQAVMERLATPKPLPAAV